MGSLRSRQSVETPAVSGLRSDMNVETSLRSESIVEAPLINRRRRSRSSTSTVNSTETSPAKPMTSKSARGRSKRPRTEKENTTPEQTDANTDFTSGEESNEDVPTAMVNKRGRKKMATVNWQDVIDSQNEYITMEPYMEEPNQRQIRPTKEDPTLEMIRDLRAQIEALAARQANADVLEPQIHCYAQTREEKTSFRKPALPKYDGTQDLDIWLLSLERCFSPNSTDEQKIQALEWHLDGNAVLAISMLRFRSKTPS